MEQQVIDIMRSALLIIIKISAPMLLMALVVGLAVSIFQTTTSIQEQTLAFIPKIIAVFLALIVFGSWMLNTMMEFFNSTYHSFNIFLK